jgi:hypothetical protein
MGDRPRITVLRVVLALYTGAAIFVFAGFALHRGATAVIGPYTPGYLVFLLGLLVLLLAPATILALLLRVDGRRVGGWALRGGVLLLAIYGFGEVLHASVRRHTFDPFVQFPGTRFDSIARERDAASVRVVAIGGSTTRNYFLPPEHRYPSILEDLLNENEDSRRFQVLNAGMDWWTTKHSHINYVTYLRGWNPDVAVVMHAINDLYRSFSPPRFAIGDYDPQWTHFYGPAIRGARPRTWVGSILNGPVAWELNRRWYAQLRFREQDYDLAEFRSLPEFEASLRSLVRTLRADGVEVILVTQPSLYNADMNRHERALLWFPSTFCLRPDGLWRRPVPGAPAMARAMEAYNEVIIRVASDEGVQVVDAARSVPRTVAYFADDVHYTEQGSAALAATVAPAVLTVAERTEK